MQDETNHDAGRELPDLADGQVEVGGKLYMKGAKGELVPVEAVKAQDKLMDETVRKIIGYARPLSEEVARFKQHCFDDVDSFVLLLAQEYGASAGGRKGNITLTTYDGLFKVQVQVADHISFGPELQTAKTLVDECLSEWSADAHADLRAVVNRAFNVDKEGKVNRAELLSLLRLEITDERWQRAMKAIRDSMRIIGSKRYVRFYRRETVDGKWQTVPIDIAAA